MISQGTKDVRVTASVRLTNYSKIPRNKVEILRERIRRPE